MLLKLSVDLTQGNKLLWQALHCLLLAGFRKGHFSLLGQDVGLLSALGLHSHHLQFPPSCQKPPSPFIVYYNGLDISESSQILTFQAKKQTDPAGGRCMPGRGTGTFPVCLVFGKYILLSTSSFVGTGGKSEPLTLTLVT